MLTTRFPHVFHSADDKNARLSERRAEQGARGAPVGRRQHKIRSRRTLIAALARRGENAAVLFAVIVFAIMLAGDVAAAQSTTEASEPRREQIDFDRYSPRIEAVRIDESEAPIIDGDLSDPVWAQAEAIDDFYQVQPVDGGAPSQRTRAYVLYDRKTLYVAFYNYDANPELIRRALLARDAPLRDDDGVRVVLDPFDSRRDGFIFGTNPNGVRVEGLIENNQTFRGEWDTIWRVSARIVDDGWVCEFAIPFQSLSFDPALDEWGFQLIRIIRRDNEEVRWSNIDQTRRRIDLTNIGRLAGVRDVKSGIGLEAQLFGTASGSYDWEADDFSGDLRPSANIFYKITPALTGSLTFLPDFSDAPLDSRQVNTGRFSLFFPETRDFFLQDAAVFEFGGQIFTRERNGLPFFSRRIGIVDDGPVDILAGAKVSGRLGRANIGAIAARTDRAGDIDGQMLASGRLSLPLLQDSKAGVVFTYGDPEGLATNAVAGADFQYRNATKWPGTLSFDVAYLQSVDDETGETITDEEAAFRAQYRSQRWNWTVEGRHIGENFQPRLGFVNRTGIRRYRSNAFRVFRPNSGFIRQAETGMFVTAITDLDDELLDRFWGGWIEFENNIGDSFFANTEVGFLDIREAFDLADEVLVPAREYRFTEHNIEAAMTSARPFALRAEYSWGGIFDGDFNEVEFGFSFRPNKHLSFGGEYEYSSFSLPEGRIDIHVAALESTIAFTPNLSLATDLQYDNISGDVTVFSRFRWEPTPEREIFVAFGHSGIIDRDRFPGGFRAQGTSLSFRFGHTFRL